MVVRPIRKWNGTGKVSRNFSKTPSSSAPIHPLYGLLVNVWYIVAAAGIRCVRCLFAWIITWTRVWIGRFLLYLLTLWFFLFFFCNNVHTRRIRTVSAIVNDIIIYFGDLLKTVYNNKTAAHSVRGRRWWCIKEAFVQLRLVLNVTQFSVIISICFVSFSPLQHIKPNDGWWFCEDRLFDGFGFFVWLFSTIYLVNY